MKMGNITTTRPPSPSVTAESAGAADVLRPALAPYKAVRAIAHGEVAKAIIPTTYDQPLNVPDPIAVGIEPVRELLDKLPDLTELWAARNVIHDALEAKADFAQIVQIVSAVMRLKATIPADKKASLIDGLSFMIEFEAEIEPVSPYVLVAALYELAKAGPFMPDASEVLAKVPRQARVFRDAARRIELLIEAREELEFQAEHHRRREAGEYDDLPPPPPCDGGEACNECIPF